MTMLPPSALAACAALAMTALATTGAAHAETDPATFNAHLQIFQFAKPAGAETTGSVGSPAVNRTGDQAAGLKAGKITGRALGYDAGSRGRVHAMIAKHAAANGVPVDLADAVVRIESRYNPSARNAGAVGLMQIKPQTARGLGYSGGAAGLMNPETNIRYGMLYLAQAYRMSGGDTCATLMRYQSGHYARRANGANRAYCAKARTIMASN